MTRMAHYGQGVGLLLAVLLWSGCATAPAPPGEPAGTGGVVAHGYALLFDLLGDERNVSKLLIIKGEREQLGDLIKAIAERAGRAYDDLEAFGKATQSLNLEETGLPAAELATRKSIAAARGKELIWARGKEFELSLLLTQHEALSYGAHLAAVTAENERDPARAKFLQDLAKDFTQLQERVVAMLLTNYALPVGGRKSVAAEKAAIRACPVL